MSLEDVYKEVILDHYRSPRNQGALPSPPAIKAEGFNPLCGDEITLYLLFDNESLIDVKIESQGCSISQASASMMSEAIRNKKLEEIDDLVDRFKRMMTVREEKIHQGESEIPEGNLGSTGLGELEALQGVVRFPVRIKCATLAWNTLLEGVERWRGGHGTSSSTFVEGQTAGPPGEIK
ncbi:MAG: SUF system NifU family Fe-S cluster assembly protein [Acidimicrobiia bacterium]